MSRKDKAAGYALMSSVGVLIGVQAYAHSASDAYLTLTVQPRENGDVGQTRMRGQWDIALRDLDFVLKLDDNGDGNIVWGELRQHQQAIAQYAYPTLNVSADGKSCRVVPTRQMVDGHADGAYASLMFDISCAGASKRLMLDYRLFFAIDPSHRAILVFHNGENVATSVLSVDNAQINLDF